MIFSRRAVQRRLDELRSKIGNVAVDGLAKRLNKPGADRMAAMWEVVVLHALSAIGAVRYEVPLTSGKEPDIELDAGSLRITADVVCVGDEGLEGENPYSEFAAAVRGAAKKLGIPRGSLDLRVQSRRTRTSRGTKTVLRLPSRNQLQSFVTKEIVPQLLKQLRAGERVLRIAIDDRVVGIDITIDPNGPYHSIGSHGAYNTPGIKDRNPLYSGLERKANQLRASERFTGVIVGDGDCKAMATGKSGRDVFSSVEIVREFFRQYSVVDFVFLITVEQQQHVMRPQGANRRLQISVHARDGCTQIDELETLCRRMMEQMPVPAMSAANGALRAREREYDIGHHGGSEMGCRKMKVSLRELTEVLAGLRTFADDGAKYVDAARRLPRSGRPNPIQPEILQNLAEGRLPMSMKVLAGEEDDNDGWVEIEFGDPDPAISPFR